MERWSCAFWGQNKFDYEPFRTKILDEIDCLIRRGVTCFYNCYRNSFDALCAAAVDKLREKYPYIWHVLVLLHKPNDDFVLPDCFDEAVYLQNDGVPARFVARNTYRKLVQSAGFVISGVARGFGVAKSVYNFAKRTLKPICNVVTGERRFWHTFSPIEIEKAIREYEERLANDEEFRIVHEEVMRRFVKESKNHKNKKHYENAFHEWVVAETKKTTEN